MKRFVLYTICALTTLLSGCFKDYEKRYLFEDNRLEFEDAVTNGNASGKTFPILGPIPSEEGRVKFRVNMTGAHSDQDRIVTFRVVPEESTAMEGRDFAFPHGQDFVIPANSSFGYIEVDLLPEGSGQPTLVLELLPREDMKVLNRYHKIGFRFLYQLTRPDPNQLQRINDIYVYNNFLIGAHSNQNIGNFVDFNTLNVYVRAGAEAHSQNIDLGFMNGSSTGLNFMTPSSTGWSAWSGWNIPGTWSHVNSGEVMRIIDLEQSELDLFRNATSVADLLALHGYFSSTISTRPGYNATNDGPSTRIRHIAPDHLVIYYSTDRQIVAAMHVKSTVPANTGEIVVDVKTGKFDPAGLIRTEVMAIEGLTSTSSNGLVNLADMTAYGFGTAQTTAQRTSTDFGYVWSTATGTNYGNFIAMSASFTGWSALESTAGTGVLNSWNAAERNPGTFVHLDNPTTEEIRAAVSITNRTQLVNAYNQAEANVAGRPGYDPAFNGPATRVRRMLPGSIIYFKSEAAGRDLYSVMIVRTLPSTASPRRMELLIKSDLN